MTYENIILDVERNDFRLTFNRPDRLNSLSAGMQEEIGNALTRIERSKPRTLLITGAGRAFCAGQDLSERDVEAGPLDLGQGPERHYNPLIRRLTALPCPVVAAVNGVAAGAGVNIALACDIVLAKQSARFVQAFSAIGLVPGCRGNLHLPRLLGQARALGFTLLGESFSAEQAQNYGMIWRAVPDDRFDQDVQTVIDRLSAAPTFGLVSAKQAIRQSWTRSLDEALDFERDLQRACGRTADYKEGVTAFKEKRRPDFKGN